MCNEIIYSDMYCLFCALCIFHLDFVQKKINRFYIKPHIYLYKGSHDKNLDDLFLLQKRNTINQNKKRSINQIFLGLDKTYRI